MARVTDTNKIELIKEAAAEMIVTTGFTGASISLIAKKAGVSEGYLYRHYSSKNDLVNDLFAIRVSLTNEKLQNLLETKDTVREVVEGYVQHIFNSYSENPIQVKFLFMLIHDFTFTIPASIVESMIAVCAQLKEKGVGEGAFSESVTEEDIYISIVNLPMQFINSRLRGYFGKTTIQADEIKHITDCCIGALSHKKSE
jgi:AcrR family transcriptional regulator